MVVSEEHGGAIGPAFKVITLKMWNELPLREQCSYKGETGCCHKGTLASIAKAFDHVSHLMSCHAGIMRKNNVGYGQTSQ